VIADFIKTGPTDAEMARAKNNLAAAAIYALDSQESLANIFGASLTSGESVDDVVGWQDEIKKVTREEVIAVAKKTLVLEHSVTGTLLPEPGEGGGSRGAPPSAPPAAGAVR
jgi:zinc protease